MPHDACVHVGAVWLGVLEHADSCREVMHAAWTATSGPLGAVPMCLHGRQLMLDTSSGQVTSCRKC